MLLQNVGKALVLSCSSDFKPIWGCINPASDPFCPRVQHSHNSAMSPQRTVLGLEKWRHFQRLHVTSGRGRSHNELRRLQKSPSLLTSFFLPSFLPVLNKSSSILEVGVPPLRIYHDGCARDRDPKRTHLARATRRTPSCKVMNANGA